MRVLLSFFVLSFSCVGFSQISILQSSNTILISPDEVSILSPAHVEYYVKEYQSQKDTIVMTLDTCKAIELSETLRKDLFLVESHLYSWSSLAEEDKTDDFLKGFNVDNCYEISSTSGDYEEDSFIVSDPGSISTIVIEEIKVRKKAGYSEWKRRKKKNCKEPLEKDCYVACLITTEESYQIKGIEHTIPVSEAAEIYTFNKISSTLSREITITNSKTIVIDIDSQEVIMINAWNERSCNE